MKFKIFISTVIAMTLGVVCQSAMASPESPSLKPFEHVDLNHYAGLWYDIAHYPDRAQEGCQNSIVRFSLRNNGDIDILNSCRDKQEGTLHHIDGLGRVVDKTTNARLKVSFFWPFSKEYIIIDQGNEYEYSVICTTDRKQLWIIARSPVMSSDVLEGIIQKIEKQGFHHEKLIKTERSEVVQSDGVSIR